MLIDRKWGVLALLFASITVNLIDRQTLSILAPVIRDELHLSNTQYSVILFCFLLGMALFQVPAGMLLDRRGSRRGLPAADALVVGGECAARRRALGGAVLACSAFCWARASAATTRAASR